MSALPTRSVTELIHSLVPDLKTRGARRILHFGCGSGSSLKDLNLRGFETHGTEIDPVLLKKELRRLPVFPYAARDLWFIPDDDYDFVFTLGRLDHLSPEGLRAALTDFTRIARVGWCVFGTELSDVYPPGVQVTTPQKGVVKALFWKGDACVSST